MGICKDVRRYRQEVRSPRPDSGTSGAEIGDMATASKTKDNRSKRHQVKLQTVQEVDPPKKIIVDVDVWEAAKQIRVMKPKDQTSPRSFHTGKKGDTQRIIKFLQSHPPSRLHSYVAVGRLKGGTLKLVKEMKLAERPNGLHGNLEIDEQDFVPLKPTSRPKDAWFNPWTVTITK